MCSDAGRTCREHANCCSKLCGPKDATGRRRCLCQSIADCPAPDQCHVATCVAGVCGETVLLGQACNDGNACITGETCQANGSCGGGTRTVCTPQSQCHTVACNPATGRCVQTPLTGTACNADNSACTADTCQAGVCIAGPPVVCAALDACHVAGVCDPTSGQCSNPNAPNDIPCENPDPCKVGGACQGGTCTGGTTVADDLPGICPSNQFCCGGSCCAGFCFNGPCCLNAGTPCTDGSQCCARDCTGGVCVDL